MATDSRVETWPNKATLEGTEILPAQSGFDEVRVNPIAITDFVGRNPYFYGIAAVADPIPGQVVVPGETIMTFDIPQRDTVPGAWDGSVFTVPNGKDGLWAVHVSWTGSNFDISGNPTFALNIEVRRNTIPISVNSTHMRAAELNVFPFNDLETSPAVMLVHKCCRT